MEGKVAKIVRIACAGARVHACFRPPRRVYEQRGRSRGEGREKGRERERGGGVGEVHIVLVLIYAARPAFLLPRYRDLSAANYTFTPFLAPSTLEHRKTRMILLIPPFPSSQADPLHPLASRQQKQKTRTRPSSRPPHLFSLVGFFLSSCRDLYLADGSRISRVSRRPDYTLFLEEERTRSKHAVPTPSK